MSHSTVLVVGENPELQLKPFDENLEVPRYVEYTKAELIAKGRKEIEEYRDSMYAKYLADPEKYEAECKNPGHMKYIATEFPLKLNWTDEEVYADQIHWYDDQPEAIGSFGEVYSTSNPRARWDWFVLGGRWTGYFKLKPGAVGAVGAPGLMTPRAEPRHADQARKSEIDWEGMLAETIAKNKEYWAEYEAEKANGNDVSWQYDIRPDDTEDSYVKRHASNSTFAVLKEGKWYERGEMGWWATVKDEKERETWDAEFNKLLADLPDDMLLSVYDVHI